MSKESLYVIDKENCFIYFIGRESDEDKIQGLQKALNYFGETNLDYCREGDPLLADVGGEIEDINNVISGNVDSNMIYADLLIYFDDSNDRLEYY